MDKEYLDALKTIKIKCHPNSNPSPLVDSALEVVELALQRLESIDNAKPSEASKCLEKIKDAFGCDMAYYNLNKEYETAEQALLKLDFLEDAMDLPTNCFSTFKNRNGNEVTIMRRERYEEYQEQEKVLKVIKEKPIESGMAINYCIKQQLKNNIVVDYKQYKKTICDISPLYLLTEEEFDLLKRWQKNGNS